MGLDQNGVQFLLYARGLGVDFAHSAMIGRQSLYLNASQLAGSFAKFGSPLNRPTLDRLLDAHGGYAEGLFECLGARQVSSFDAAAYEGATQIHDMNLPLPEQHKRQFSMVLDGGSLEHVFNIATALKNCLEMVRVGGHYLAISPANNFMGHGFYQISPELYFSVLRPVNGYELLRVLVYEDRPRARWYAVSDPAAVQRRVTLANRRPVYLLVIARRVSDVVPLQTAPQQSDYAAAWDRGKDGFRRRDTVSRRLKRSFKGLLRRTVPFRSKFYRRIDLVRDAAISRSPAATDWR
jgi:hypothetical protein